MSRWRCSASSSGSPPPAIRAIVAGLNRRRRRLVSIDRVSYLPTPLTFDRLPDEEAVRRSEQLLELMLRRRSVRHFAPDPVPPAVIENALRTAGTAPSGANQQPWTFVVVTSDAMK